MPQLLQPFDATKIDPTQGEGNLPVGKHKVVIYSSDIKPTKEKDGGYLQLNVKVIEGDFTGMSGAMRFNIYLEKSPEAMEIARRRLSAVCHVCNTYNLTQSEQLYNIPFYVEVVAQADPKYTEIKKVYDVNGNEPGKAGQQQQQLVQQQTNQQAFNTAFNQQQPAQVINNPGPPEAYKQPNNAAWGQQQPQQQPQHNEPWGNQQAQPQQQPQNTGWNQPQQSNSPSGWAGFNK